MKTKKKTTHTKKKKVATIDEIATKAKELGVSYGKYVEMLTIEEQRKERKIKNNE